MTQDTELDLCCGLSAGWQSSWVFQCADRRGSAVFVFCGRTPALLLLLCVLCVNVAANAAMCFPLNLRRLCLLLESVCSFVQQRWLAGDLSTTLKQPDGGEEGAVTPDVLRLSVRNSSSLTL